MEGGGLRSSKPEVASCHSIAGRKVHCAQGRRRVTIVASVRDGVTDCKLHHSVCACKICVGHDIAGIRHDDFLALETGKVDNYLVTFGHGNIEIRSSNGL